MGGRPPRVRQQPPTASGGHADESDQTPLRFLAGTSPEADAAATASDEPLETFTLQNGVVLRFKPVPPLLVKEAQMRVPRPEIPMVRNTDSDRDEPNPNDPNYMIELETYYERLAEIVLRVGLIRGVVIESLPEGMVPVESDEWIDECKAIGDAVGETMDIHAEPTRARWLDYMRFYIIPSEVDLFAITRIVSARVAVTEAEVRNAIATFRSVMGGFADRLAAAANDGDASDGDHLPDGDAVDGA